MSSPFSNEPAVIDSFSHPCFFNAGLLIIRVSSLLTCVFCFRFPSHSIDIQMESLDKQLVFYVNVVSVTVFALIMLYFFITTKPKDAVD